LEAAFGNLVEARTYLTSDRVDNEETNLDITTPYVVAGPRSGTQVSGQKVELIDDRLPHESSRLQLYQRRIRQVSRLFFVTYLAFAVRDLIASKGNWRDQQLFIILVATLLQLGLVLATRTGISQSRVGRFFLELMLILLCGTLIDTLHFLSLRDWESYADYILSHPRDAQIVIANTWCINWFAVIVGYSVAVPRAWRQAVLVAILMSLNPFVVTILAIATMPELQAIDTGYIFGQHAIWSMVAIAIAGFAAAQTNKLRDEVQQARRFGQYVLKQKIGEGGMGEVFLAEHRLLKRPCVIKQIRQDRAHDPKIVARFEREVKLLATLTNWHTVEVFDYGRTTDGHFYYVMEYLPGLNLEELMFKHGTLPPERAAYLLAQVCLGLREAHAVGLIHRDIKPNNIIVGPRGGIPDVAKLLDFGLVQGPFDSQDNSDGKITRDGMVVGSVNYMSPEQARGETVDGRSDIYSVGITLFYLIEGHAPFQKRTVVETLAAHLHEPVPNFTKPVNPLLAIIVRKCLAKRAEDRYHSVVELREELQKAAQDWNESHAQKWWEQL
jgi:eukaryotic-like serine/threonine-protein kinase